MQKRRKIDNRVHTMKELIETLNATSAARVIFYSFVFVIIVIIVVDGIADIVRHFKK